MRRPEAVSAYLFESLSTIHYVLSTPSASFEIDIFGCPALAAARCHSLFAIWVVVRSCRSNVSISKTRNLSANIQTVGKHKKMSQCYVLCSSACCYSCSNSTSYTIWNVFAMIFNTGTSSCNVHLPVPAVGNHEIQAAAWWFISGQSAISISNSDNCRSYLTNFRLHSTLPGARLGLQNQFLWQVDFS